MTSKQFENRFENEENKIEVVEQSWIEYSSQDRIGAMLQKVKDLETLNLQYKVSWPEGRSFPPFLLPKDEENASIINEILVKSMETQSSTCTGIKNSLIEQGCFTIHGLLSLYFKQIPGREDEIFSRLQYAFLAPLFLKYMLYKSAFCIP